MSIIERQRCRLMRKPPLSPTQRRLLAMMKAGQRLMWYGDNGPELQGTPFWPQKRTVRALIKIGALKWGEYSNEAQREAGIIVVLLNPDFDPKERLPWPPKNPWARL